MKKVMLAMCVGLLVSCVIASEEAETMELVPVVEKKPLIQVAILLDTSSSMSGLIEQAKIELWAIVNEFIFARKDGVAPEFRLALYEYGKSSLAKEVGYIRQIEGFTTDLDKVSEELFALRTNGGNEYCGWVIKDAVENLAWSESAEDLKVIFIAGNEPFTQGPVDHKDSCKAAITKGIIVNTIHCGGGDETWKNGAMLADGRYLTINQNQQVVHIAAPQDEEIAELNSKLNDTYIAYGARGLELKKRQVIQDKNNSMLSKEAEVQRAVAKSSKFYDNRAWDMVDALDADQIELAEMKEEDLPEDMLEMSQEEREEYVEGKAKERSDIQKKIQRLNEERKKFVADEMKNQPQGAETLGSAIVQAISEQAKKKNFEFVTPEAPDEETK